MKAVEIIGGGLAGLAAGIGLRHAGVPVTLYESGSYPRHRTCGEFIAGLDGAAVERLGLASLFADIPRRDRVAWFGSGREPRRWRMPRPALVISRRELDARLAETFTAAGGELITSQRHEATDAHPGRVLATGRSVDPRSPWIGIKVHVAGLAIDGDLEFHPGRHAYVGLCALGDGCVNVCGLFRRRPGVTVRRETGLAHYLEACGMHRLAARLATAETMPGTFCAVAGIRFGRQSAARDQVRLGDAFAVIPPFAGHGMAMAFHSAAWALDPLIAWAREEETSWDATARAIDRRQQKRFAQPLGRAAALHPFVLTPVVQRIADALNRCRLVPLRLLCAAVH